MSDVGFSSKRRFEGKVWGQCEDCNDYEYYPIVEHRRFHELYDLIEGHIWNLRCIADELMPMLKNDKKFTYFAQEKTQGGFTTFKLRFTQVGRIGTAMFDEVGPKKESET